MQRFLGFVLILGLLIIFSGCSSHTMYANSDTLELKYQDLSSLAKTSAEKFLSDYVPQGKNKYILTIENAENETGDKIDVELFGRQFARIIRKSDKYLLSASVGASKGKMINEVRKIRDDEEYNEDKKIEKGELLSPDLSLKIKIKKEDIQMRGPIDTARYVILLSVEDVKQGIVLWDTEEIIDKSVDVSQYLKSAPKNKEVKEDVVVADNKKNQFLLELRAGIGERNTPILAKDDAQNFSYAFGAKLGFIHRWSSRYAIALYGEYEASFQPYDIRKKREYEISDKALVTHSVGIGTRLEMSIFYLSAGFLYDTREFNFGFFEEGYSNINPHIGAGLVLGTPTVGVIIGGHYVFSLGNGMYLNRGANADLGMYLSF